MVRWDEIEAELNRKRRASAVGSNRRSGLKPNRGNTGRGGRTGSVEGKLRWMKVAGRWSDRIATQQAEKGVEHVDATRAANWCSWFERGLALSFFGLPHWRLIV